jgi:hypothetical protein
VSAPKENLFSSRKLSIDTFLSVPLLAFNRKRLHPLGQPLWDATETEKALMRDLSTE